MIFILLLFISAGLNAQFYEYGQDAGSLKWYQFKSPHYTVIHPAGADSVAKTFARRLEHYYPYLGQALDHRHSHMPVIIHNESSFSNGVFVWAPKRLEIFTNPDPNGYYQDWLTQLALHEGRHAVQIDKLNQGFTKGLYFLGGEQAVGAMAIFLPYWYLEGDAVDSETRLSATGRGRQPSFEMAIKAQMLEAEKLWSFSKASMGSYKNHIPNHYQLGYLMVRHGRRTYGDQFWIDFQQYAARKPFLLNPTWFSMRKYGISSKTKFYREALNSYKDHWQITAEKREYTPLIYWKTKSNRHYTSYTFPHEVSNHKMLSLKTGIDQIPEFVMLNRDGTEKKLFRPGFLNSGRVSYSRNKIVWDEFVPDTRWSNRNYSIIRSYNLITGEVRNLGKRTRYFSPAISGDGEQLVVVEQTEKQEFNLAILNMDGSLEQKIAFPGNRFLQQPVWMDQDTALVVLVSVDSGKSLYSYSLESGKWNRLFDAGMDDISYPSVKGTQIFFSGTFSGIDNIYCYYMGLNQAFQLTSSRFGAFHPHVSSDGKTLYYSNYTSDGYDVSFLDLEEGLWKPIEMALDHTEQIDYQQTPEEARIDNLPNNEDSLVFDTKRYRKGLHLFNVHSWAPFYFDYLNPELTLDPEQLPLSLGVSLLSQNRLSTAVSQLAYEYKDGFHMFHSGIKLKGRYPVLNLYFDYGGEPNVLSLAEGDSVISLPQDIGFTAQSYVPFRINTGKFLSLIQPQIDYFYRRDIQYNESQQSYEQGAHYFYYSLYATSYLRKGLRDILPRAGVTVKGGYYHAPFENQVFGSVAIGGVTTYLPGLLRHQTIRLSAFYQKQFPLDMSHPAFINLISMPRGLQGIYGEILTKYSADYVFPILYPDLEIGSLLYLKRIRGSLWTDYMVGTNVIIYDPQPHYEDKNFNTFGADLVLDMNIFRISFPLSVGGRIIYEPQTGQVSFEGIYSIDIN
ncbi:MAG: hypothetical protein U9R49_11890 [Bacteroidota bacterium]|nr:hypothetical protein [Bacteroidota bacterium]